MPATAVSLSTTEQQFADTVDRIFNDASFQAQMQSNPVAALQSAGWTLTAQQQQAINTPPGYSLPASTDQYVAIPLTKPLVNVITKGTKPVVTVITKGTAPVVSVVVNTA